MLFRLVLRYCSLSSIRFFLVLTRKMTGFSHLPKRISLLVSRFDLLFPPLLREALIGYLDSRSCLQLIIL